MKKKKLNTLLGLREKVELVFKNMLDDMFKKFKNKQSLFFGERRTYDALDGYADEPSKRGFSNVASTVKEQLDWMSQSTKDFMEIIFSIEKTNASGKVKAELIVEGESWGEYTSLELLRLRSTLENPKLAGIYKELPVRSETEIWNLSVNEIFEGREIYETPIEEGFSKTTLKESYILTDPHAEKGNRQPIVGEKSVQVNIGKYTIQKFSGSLSMLKRAKMQRKYMVLLKAVIEALENANNIESETSDLGIKVFDYINS